MFAIMEGGRKGGILLERGGKKEEGKRACLHHCGKREGENRNGAGEEEMGEGGERSSLFSVPCLAGKKKTRAW